MSATKFFIFFLLVLPLASSESCQRGWKRLGGSCFKIFQRLVNFEEAVYGCKQSGGRLAILDTEEKADFIREEYFTPKERKGNTWIGLVRKNSSNWDSSFEWLDGSPLTQDHWYPHEPNNALGIQNCVAIWGGSMKYRGTWYDYFCETMMHALCEKAVTEDETVGEEVVDKRDSSSSSFSSGFYLAGTFCILLLIIMIFMCYVGDFTGARDKLSRTIEVKSRKLSHDLIFDKRNNNGELENGQTNKISNF